MITPPELMAMDTHALHALVARGEAISPEAVADTQYQGVDLSLPGFARRLLWHTFRKTFHKDPTSGRIRGWNVRMEQHGVEGPRVAMRNRAGGPLTFGHYELRSGAGVRFPRGLTAPTYLDYTVAGNPWWDLGRFGFTPLVAVNPGRQDLLLGWEVFRLGPVDLPLPLYYALRLEGPLEEVVAVPRPPVARLQAG